MRTILEPFDIFVSHLKHDPGSFQEGSWTVRGKFSGPSVCKPVFMLLQTWPVVIRYLLYLYLIKQDGHKKACRWETSWERTARLVWADSKLMVTTTTLSNRGEKKGISQDSKHSNKCYTSRSYWIPFLSAKTGLRGFFLIKHYSY